MAKADFAFSHTLRVRWSETDAQGVVFNARFLDYADIAVTEYYRAVGIRLNNPDVPLEFHVKHAALTWSKPIKPDELIDVFARTVKAGITSITKRVEIHGHGADDDLRCVVDLVSVHVDLATHRPMAVPEWLKTRLFEFDATL